MEALAWVFRGLSKRQRLWLIGLVFCGFAARVVWIFAMPYFVPLTMQADPQEYNQLAKNLLSGNGYRLWGLKGHFLALLGDRLKEPTASRPPLYPVIVAAVYWLVGERYRAVFLLHCLMDVVTILAGFALARLLFDDVRVALLAAGFCAFYLPFFQQDVVLMTESLVTLLTTLYLLALVVAVRQRRFGWFAVAGAFLGAAALARPGALALCLPLGAALVFILRRAGVGWARAVAMPAVMLVSFGLVLSPWIVRNAVVFGEFIPGSTLTGRVMLTGLYMATIDPSKGVAPLVPDQARHKVEGLGEVATNDILTREAIRYLVRHPLVWLLDAPRKIGKMWLNAVDWRHRYFLYYPTTNRNHYVNYSFFIPNAILLIACGIALLCYRGQWVLWAGPVLFTLAFFTFAETFVEPAGRHSIKLIPSLIVIAAYAFVRLFAAKLKEGTR